MHIAFDADDTLWHNEPIFVVTQERVAKLLEQWVATPTFDQRILEVESRNLEIFGYGAKGFTLSLIETAFELTDGKVTSSVIREILDAGKQMMEHPVELLEGVEATLAALAADHPLLLVTKGDLFHQESKLAQSGLAEYFTAIEVVSEKDPETYRQILDRHQIAAQRFVMIGNSVKSDILPVVEIGGNAIHIPYHSNWALDMVEHRGAEQEGFFVADTISEVGTVLERIAAQGWS